MSKGLEESFHLCGFVRPVELEFGMLEGQLRIEVRQALLFHTIRRLRLETSDGVQSEQPNRIVLVNRQEIEPFLLGR